MQQAEIKTFADNPAVAAAFAADFCAWENSQPAGQKLTVALSGGSTPKLLFEALAKDFADKIDWQRIHFFWGDERCVAPDDSESNYGVTKSLLLDGISIPESNVHRVEGETDPAAERIRYEQEIREHVQRNAAGIPEFDLMLLGMGDDGHTASIFPHQIEFLKSPNICEVAVHPVSGQQRITLTGAVINASKKIVFLVTGAAKAKVLTEIMGRSGTWDTYPASFVTTAGSLTLYLDAAAAEKLS